MENKKLTWKHYLGIAVVAVLVIYFVIGFYFSKKFFWGTKINGMNVACLLYTSPSPRDS